MWGDEDGYTGSPVHAVRVEMQLSLFQLMPGLFMLGGIGLFVWGVVSWLRTRTTLEGMTHTTGIITNRAWRWDEMASGQSRLSYPTVRFQISDGRAVEFRSAAGTNPAAGKVGDQVVVVYNPLNPQDARINTFMAVWFQYLVIFGVAVGFVVLGSWFWLNFVPLP